MIFIKDFKMVISKINEDQERIKGLILSCEDRAFHWYSYSKFWPILTVTDKNKQHLGKKSTTNFAIHVLLFTD